MAFSKTKCCAQIANRLAALARSRFCSRQNRHDFYRVARVQYPGCAYVALSASMKNRTLAGRWRCCM